MEWPTQPTGVTPAAVPHRLRLSSPQAGDRRPAGDGERVRQCPVTPKPPKEPGMARVNAWGGEGTHRGAAVVGNRSYTPHPDPHPRWWVAEAGPGWGSPTLGRGSYLFGSEEHLLLGEAQAAHVGTELLQVLLAHIGRPCCQRDGIVKGEGGGKRVLGGALLLGGAHSVDRELAACLPPSFPSPYQGKRGFLPCLRELGMPMPIDVSPGRDVPHGSGAASTHPRGSDPGSWR